MRRAMAQYVREVMTPAVTAVRPEASVVEAAQLMGAQGIGSVLVTEDGQLVGLLTDRDITLRTVAEGVDPLAVDCRSVCTPDPVTVGPGEEVRAAGELMLAHAVRRLPVTENGRTLGVVGIGDLLRRRDRAPALAALARCTSADGRHQNGAEA